jgi:hypothetical protein
MFLTLGREGIIVPNLLTFLILDASPAVNIKIMFCSDV